MGHMIHSSSDPAGDIFLFKWRPYVWIILAASILYLRTLSFDITFLDDKQLILDNYDFIGNVSNIPNAFLQKVFHYTSAPYYRPLLTVSFMLDSLLFGRSIGLYHATNILIHIIGACLVFHFLSRLGYRRASSFAMAALFAVHPVISQAVAWVPGRNDSLLAVFALASIISFINYREHGRTLWAALHIFFLVLALFTKETAVMVIIVCMLYVCLIGPRKMSGSARLSLLLAWAFVVLAWLALRQVALVATMEANVHGITMSIIRSMPAIIQFAGKVLFPFNLSVFPTIPDTTFISGYASILAITVLLALSSGKRMRYVIFGLLFFLAFLFPSLIRPTPECILDFQEHRLYLPIVGLMIVLMEIDLVKRLDLRKMAAILPLVSIFIVFSVVNVAHSGNFKDRFTFWKNAVETSPNAPFVRMSAGFAYQMAGRLEEAEREYRNALRLDPMIYGARLKLGFLYREKKALKEAEAEFKKHIAVEPSDDVAIMALGVVYYEQGRSDEAETMWRRAFMINPVNVNAAKNLAIYYKNKGDNKRALFFVNYLGRLGIKPPDEFMKSFK